MLDYYNRQGEPITCEHWCELFENHKYRIIKRSKVSDGVEVSTVWLGLSYGTNAFGRPLIFETLVFGGDKDGEMWRYATEAEALTGHDTLVAQLSSESPAV